MSLPSDLLAAIEADHRALDALVRGDPNPKKRMFSRKDDVTLGNSFGPPARGWANLEARLEQAVAQLRDGAPIRFERISEYGTADLAYTVEFERWRGKAGPSEEMANFALRVTTVWRREEEGWRIVHRQADGVTRERGPETIRDDDEMAPPEIAPRPSDAEAVIERMHEAMGRFIRGDPSAAVDLFSRVQDVTLGNPFGPFARGWQPVSEVATRAATNYRDGEVIGYERIASYQSADLACFVEIERYRAKIGGANEASPVSLRVSTVVRHEGDGWRIVSRHADPITAPRSPESVITER